jgi:fructose-1,6-bisphosphatase I
MLGMTLTRFIIEQQRQFPGVSGRFTALLEGITTAAKIIGREVNKAGLAETMGLTGRINVHGEQVQKLDEFANVTIIQALDHTGLLAAMASEEMEDFYPIPDPHARGPYILVFDPVDGSSNIDVNVSIGSIFSILRRKGGSGPTGLDDFLQPGVEQICAGYVIYGSSTMLVYTTGNGVDGFTLDPSVGEFFLSHPDIQIPERGKIYSINEGNSSKWDEATTRYVAYLKEEDAESGRPYSGRYIGSLVADFHRNLLKGGIFLYPGDKKNPSGKLRLLYECNPMSFIAEQAGGAASDGRHRVMEIQPEMLHQRIPFIVGSKHDVADATRFMSGGGN